MNALASDIPHSSPWLNRFLDALDRRPAVLLPLWITVYFVTFWPAAQRPLWFDELFTYHVALSPTFDHFIGSIRTVDLNPPLGFLAVRASIAVFGDSPLSARLPSMVAFLGASLVAYHVVRRKWGGVLGLAALGIFWLTGFGAYAVEARPYALMLAFFSLALLFWLDTCLQSRWTWAHTGLLFSLAAMLLTHCFAPVYAMSIGAGELVRTMSRRRFDGRVWIAYALPFSVVALYVPLVSHARAIVYPFAFQPTLMTVVSFYGAMVLLVVPVIAFAAIAAAIPSPYRRVAVVGERPRQNSHEAAFILSDMLAPVALIAYAWWSETAFWNRYGICSALGLTLLTAALLARMTHRRVLLGGLTALVALVLFSLNGGGTNSLLKRYSNVSTAYRTLLPDLPFVAASGLTFYEMDHREPPEFVRRLHYLTDREAAVQYAHATIFEGFYAFRDWIPFRGRVSPYRDFVRNHSKFLVLATPGYPEDWLLLKLDADGADIRLLADLPTGYRDRKVFEVTLASHRTAKGAADAHPK